jgi:predicted HicB family RNase H-like nuclease
MAGRPRSSPRPRDERVKTPTSIAIKERLRRQLVRAARRNGDSLNQEIMRRLERSFEMETVK